MLFERFNAFLKRLLGYGADPDPEPRTTTYAVEDGLVEITTPSSTASFTDDEKAHHQFIVEHWPRLAAAAYTGFQRHGIGVVVVEEHASESAVEHPFQGHTLMYATGMGMWTQTPPHSAAPDWLDEQFQTYEPMEAGLFLFRDAEAQPPRPYRAEGTLTPPEAQRRIRAPFN